MSKKYTYEQLLEFKLSVETLAKEYAAINSHSMILDEEDGKQMAGEAFLELVTNLDNSASDSK